MYWSHWLKFTMNMSLTGLNKLLIFSDVYLEIWGRSYFLLSIFLLLLNISKIETDMNLNISLIPLSLM